MEQLVKRRKYVLKWLRHQTKRSLRVSLGDKKYLHNLTLGQEYFCHYYLCYEMTGPCLIHKRRTWVIFKGPKSMTFNYVVLIINFSVLPWNYGDLSVNFNDQTFSLDELQGPWWLSTFFFVSPTFLHLNTFPAIRTSCHFQRTFEANTAPALKHFF